MNRVLVVFLLLLFGIHGQADAQLTAQVRATFAGGDVVNLLVDDCDRTNNDITCDMKVTVRPRLKKRCSIEIDKSVMVSRFRTGNGKVTFRWTLDVAGGGMASDYRFEVDTGIDFADNDDDDEFKPVTSNPNEITFEHAFKSKNKGFAYNINVQRKIGGNWKRCGTLDPIIVNRG